jgi:Flp pilus assembly protein CpaB
MIRRLRRRPAGLWFAVAAILTVLAVMTSVRASARSVPTTVVLVAATDLAFGASGAQLGAGVREQLVPRDGALPGVLRRREELTGRVLSMPVAAGEPITQSSLGGNPAIAPRPLAPGERAISVPASTAGAALPALVPGARVDVIASGDMEGSAARVVVSGAEVIAQSALVDAEGAPLDAGHILLRVDAEASLDLGTALDSARGVRVLARPASTRTEVMP